MCLTYTTKKKKKLRIEGKKEEAINISTLWTTGIVKCFCFKTLNNDPLLQFLENTRWNVDNTAQISKTQVSTFLSLFFWLMSNCFLWQAHAVKLHKETDTVRFVPNAKFSIHTLLFSKLLQTFNILLAIASLGRVSRSSFRKHFLCHYMRKRAEKREFYSAPFQVLSWSEMGVTVRDTLWVKLRKSFFLFWELADQVFICELLGEKKIHAFYDLF